jgi:hypothetical protein
MNKYMYDIVIKLEPCQRIYKCRASWNLVYKYHMKNLQSCMMLGTFYYSFRMKTCSSKEWKLHKHKSEKGNTYIQRKIVAL